MKDLHEKEEQDLLTRAAKTANAIASIFHQETRGFLESPKDYNIAGFHIKCYSDKELGRVAEIWQIKKARGIFFLNDKAEPELLHKGSAPAVFSTLRSLAYVRAYNAFRTEREFRAYDPEAPWTKDDEK